VTVAIQIDYAYGYGFGVSWKRLSGIDIPSWMTKVRQQPLYVQR